MRAVIPSCGRLGGLFEGPAGFEHGMHYDCQLAHNGNCRALETDLFTEVEAPKPLLSLTHRVPHGVHYRWWTLRHPLSNALGRVHRTDTLLARSASIRLAYQPDRDRYGRQLARLMVDDRDVADIMVGEGLARRYSGGQRRSWC